MNTIWKVELVNTIWKFELEVIHLQDIYMPDGAILLDVQVQNGVPCLWARVDPLAPLVPRGFVTHGTGHAVPDTTVAYVGTYQINDGKEEYHVFEAA